MESAKSEPPDLIKANYSPVFLSVSNQALQRSKKFCADLLEFAVRFICPPIVLSEFFDESKGLS